MQKRIYSFALLSRRGIMAAMRLNRSSSPDGKLRTRTLAIPLGGRLAARDTGAAAGLGTAVLRRMDRRRGGRSGQGPQSGAADRAQPGLPGLRRAAGAAARKVAGALLVAPADVERADAPGLSARLRADPRTSLPFQSVVVASDNDPYCRLERARLFAGTLGQPPGGRARRGHINADSGLGDWPQGLKLLGATPALVVAGLAAARAHLAGTRAPLVAPGLSATRLADTLSPRRSFHWGPKQKPRDARVRGGLIGRAIAARAESLQQTAQHPGILSCTSRRCVSRIGRGLIIGGVGLLEARAVLATDSLALTSRRTISSASGTESGSAIDDSLAYSRYVPGA